MAHSVKAQSTMRICQVHVDYCSTVDVKVAVLLNLFLAEWHQVHTVFVLVNVNFIV